MARAAIELSSDIRPFLPFLSRQIEGCAYNSQAGLAAFHIDSIVVVIYPKEINIYQIQNEEDAGNVLEWLKKILEKARETQNEEN